MDQCCIHVTGVNVSYGSAVMLWSWIGDLTMYQRQFIVCGWCEPSIVLFTAFNLWRHQNSCRLHVHIYYYKKKYFLWIFQVLACFPPPPHHSVSHFFCPTIYFVFIAITSEVNYNLLAEGRSFYILRSVKRAFTKVSRISCSHYYAKFKRRALSGAIFAPGSNI